jgi:hypothetical protein
MEQTMDMTAIVEEMDPDQALRNLLDGMRQITMSLSLVMRHSKTEPLTPEQYEMVLTMIEGTGFDHAASGLFDYLDHLKFTLADSYGIEVEEPEEDDEDDEDDEEEDSGVELGDESDE